MASSRRKQDEKHLKILRELVSKPVNRTCFDCHQKGPTYINMTIGSFVCTTCSGILRGLNPPHRVKSISMASFTSDEVDQIKLKGNQYCQAVWLGLYNGKSNIFPDTKDEHKIRDFMINKYEKKRFYVDPAVALKNGENSQIKSESSSSASTPGSDSRSLGAGNANSFTSVSRPIANIQNAGSSPSLNGLQTQNSSLKLSSSVDLLNSLGKSTGTPSGTNLVIGNKDPFNTPVTSKPTTNESFANFENANIFSSASISKPTPNPYSQFSFNPLTPLSPSSSSSSSKPLPTATPNPVGSATNVSTSAEDRYAALKDLDEAFKCQKEVEISSNTNSVMFGSPPNGSGQPQQTGNMFGTSPVSSGNGFYHPNIPAQNQGWNATFPPVNPFTGNGASNSNVGAPWANGNKFGSSSTSGQQQSNPFAGGTDPNFNNGQFMPGFGINNANTNSNWSNFGNSSNLQNGSNKLNTNPWGPGSTPNPFNVPPVVPPNGSSFNPFL